MTLSDLSNILYRLQLVARIPQNRMRFVAKGPEGGRDIVSTPLAKDNVAMFQHVQIMHFLDLKINLYILAGYWYMDQMCYHGIIIGLRSRYHIELLDNTFGKNTHPPMINPIITSSKCYVMIHILHMMTSSNGNIFRVTGHFCGKFTGLRWISRTKASDAELWCFHWSTPE